MKRYPHTFSGRKASQSKYELESLISLFKKHGVKRYLEIGARDGDTFYEIVKHCDLEYGLAVDLPGGLWGKSSTERSLKKAVESLKIDDYKVDCIFGDSSDEFVIQSIHSLGPFDAILIDGDHTYKGVKKDWDNYKDLAPIIAFHDIVGEGQKELVKNNPVQVPKLWKEIKDGNSIEFVDKDSKMGIGVWLKK